MRRHKKFFKKPEKPRRRQRDTKKRDFRHKKFRQILTKNEIPKTFLKDLKIVEGLDEGQRKAVLSDNSRTLVLAGAGAGKTKVLLSRILHLIQNKQVPSGNILAVTFTKDASNEMKNRLIEYFEPRFSELLKEKLGRKEMDEVHKEIIKRFPEIRHVTISTIHSLCFQILRTDGAKIYNTNFKVIRSEDQKTEGYQAESSQDNLIRNIIKKLISEDIDFFEKIRDYLQKYIAQESKISVNPVNQNFAKEKSGYCTMDKKYRVRSKSEQLIANFLYDRGIAYEYEKEATWIEKEDKTKSYHPDFYLPDYDIYIEHWLVAREDEKVPYPPQGFNKEQYLRERDWKINQFRKHNKVLVESFESQMRGDLKEFYSYLESELIKKTHGTIRFKAVQNPIDLLDPLNTELGILATSLTKTINLAKSNRVSIDTIKDNLEGEEHNEINDFFDIFFKVFFDYEHFLKRESLIDFNDMIHKVVDLFNLDKQVLKKYQDQFKHILIDEYQDVSAAQVELIKLLLTKDNNLFAVGDDWQSIYGFRGSEVEYILNFKNEFKGSKIIALPYNYRSGENIVEASKKVILKNPKQMKKDVSAKNLSLTEKIYQFNAFNNVDGARFIVEKIRKFMSEGVRPNEILILYRRTHHIKPYKEYFLKFPEIKGVSLKTIHGSKGLESRIVFVVGLYNGPGGFPYVWEDERIVQKIKSTPLNKKEEEERRLFYVAMTRAKERLYLISELGNVSDYCRDIPREYKDVLCSESFPTEDLFEEYKKVLSLLKEGKDVSEIAKITETDEMAVEQRISWLISKGILPVSDFVDDETYDIIAKKIGKDSNKVTRLNPIKKELPSDIEYGEIKYVLADLKRKDNIENSQ